MPEIIQIELLGRKHTITLPGMAEREELAAALHELNQGKLTAFQTLRRLAAALGLCTRLGRESGQTYAGHGYDLAGYGGAVYAWLRQQGVEPRDIVAPGRACLGACAESLMPREVEVKARADFSDPAGAN